MTGPNPFSADWDRFIATVAEHQIRSERETSFLRDSAEMERILTGLPSFHEALRNDSISVEELTALAEPLTGPPFAALRPDTLARLRQDLARCPIRFTPVEPPASTAYLARSYAGVSRLAFGPDARHAFLLATDNRYRPHASVQQWAPDRYLLLMGRYLRIDTYALSQILAQLIIKAGAQFPGSPEPWADPDFPSALFTTARADQRLHQQIAYGMCAAVEGERYRTTVSMDDPGPEAEHVGREIAAGALDFMMGHELSHIAHDHLHAAGQPVCELPHYVSEIFDRVQPPEIVENYLRHYWPTHSLEHEADLDAVWWAAGRGKTGAWDLRLMGAQLAISLIAFIDRANYMLKSGRDPVDVVGLQHYGLPGLIDLVLPMPEHPWGKTRATAVTSAVYPLYGDYFDPAHLQRKTLLMRSVADILGSKGVQALSAVRWASRRPGEYVAMVLPNDRLVTLYWPPDFIVGRDKHEETVSTASRFYADIAPDLLAGDIIEEDYGRSTEPG